MDYDYRCIFWLKGAVRFMRNGSNATHDFSFFVGLINKKDIINLNNCWGELSQSQQQTIALQSGRSGWTLLHQIARHLTIEPFFGREHIRSIRLIRDTRPNLSLIFYWERFFPSNSLTKNNNIKSIFSK